MVHRASGENTSNRAFGCGARASVQKSNSNKLMQEHDAKVNKGESRKGDEGPEMYGAVSVPHDADESGSGECTVNYMGGNRSFPVHGPVGDRRHRLRGLAKGDYCNHRGKDDSTQSHLSDQGIHHSAPKGKTVRMQLVPAGSSKANAPQSKSKATQAQRDLYARHSRSPEFEERLWAGLEPDLQDRLQIELDRLEGRVSARAASGNGGSSGSQQQQSSNKPTGQKAVRDAGEDSADFCHIKDGEARMSSASKVRLSTGKDDGDTLHEAGGGKDYVGGTPAKHQFAKILTTAGPSVNGFAKIG